MGAFRQWAGYAVTVTLLVELSACSEAGSLPPTVASGAPESPRTVAAADPNSANTVRRSVPEQPRAVGRRPDHLVVMVLGNKHRSDVIGNPRAQYLNKLARQDVNMTHSYGVTRPSQPNYLAMFSGSTHGVRSNACPQRFKKRQNLGSQLRRVGLSFTGYTESLPRRASPDVSGVVTSASTTRGSISLTCREALISLSVASPATTASFQRSPL